MKHLHVSNCALSELKHRSGCNGAFLLSHATVALVIRMQMSTKAQVHAWQRVQTRCVCTNMRGRQQRLPTRGLRGDL